MWEAVFADVGVAVLAILNATRVRRYTAPAAKVLHDLIATAVSAK